MKTMQQSPALQTTNKLTPIKDVTLMISSIPIKDCRYLLACEAAWRIYGFDIHYRFPHVETLPFYLPNEQSIIFDESDSLDYTLDKALVNETKFQASLLCLEFVYEKTWHVMAMDVESIEGVKKNDPERGSPKPDVVLLSLPQPQLIHHLRGRYVIRTPSINDHETAIVSSTPRIPISVRGGNISNDPRD
ncbi:hypothetical protein Tco_1293294 [Tanacetum coccineum]